MMENDFFASPNFLLEDSFMNQMLSQEEQMLMNALSSDPFDVMEEFGGDLDQQLNERSVIYAAQAAAGLNRGGMKRAAFSMNDLTALDPLSSKKGNKKKVALQAVKENKVAKLKPVLEEPELSTMGDHMLHGMQYPVQQQAYQPMYPPPTTEHAYGVPVQVKSSGSALRRVASSPNMRIGHAKINGDAKGGGEEEKRIGTLTLEERRARILRYRQKRHERNFRKRIKYNCRKTLADSRPRIRGRFARNDEIEMLKKEKA